MDRRQEHSNADSGHNTGYSHMYELNGFYSMLFKESFDHNYLTYFIITKIDTRKLSYYH